VTEDSTSPYAIQATGLTKKFATFRALAGLDLQVADGESVALFGPNGAGKTTLIRILTLGLKPTTGELRLAGLSPRTHDRAIRGRMGVISHQSFLYDDLTARQNLEFYAAIYGVEQPRQRAAELLEMVGLSHRADDAVGTFSRGMQQRVALARSLVHDPEIIFLDEPFSGLDPHAAGMLRRTLERLRRQRRTVFMVTHNLTQGLELSDRWLILDRGRLIDEGISAETDAAAFETAYFERIARRSARVAP